jgi:hypothetical protein
VSGGKDAPTSTSKGLSTPSPKSPSNACTARQAERNVHAGDQWLDVEDSSDRQIAPVCSYPKSSDMSLPAVLRERGTNLAVDVRMAYDPGLEVDHRRLEWIIRWDLDRQPENHICSGRTDSESVKPYKVQLQPIQSISEIE